jgi:HEAT repeat protein
MRFTNLVLTWLMVVSFALTSQAQTSNARSEVTLLTVLRSSQDRKERADACRELAIVGGNSSIPVLARLLADDSLSHMARYALERIPGSDKAIRDALPGLQGANLVGAIHTLGVRADHKSTRVLTAYLAHENPDVARSAAFALGRIGTASAGQAMLKQMAKATTPEQKRFLAEGILRCTDALLADSDAKDAQRLCDALFNMDLAHQVKTAALRGSVLARGKDGAAYLESFLQGESYPMFVSALRVLRTINSPEMSALMIRSMERASGERRILLIEALGARHEQLAVPVLTRVLRESDPAVLKAALESLGQIGDPNSAPAVQPFLFHKNDQVRSAAAETLGSLPGEAVDDAIAQMAKSGQSEAQLVAMDLLVHRRMASQLETLMDLARSADSKVRLAAVRKAGELAGAGGAPDLLKLLLIAKSSEEIGAAEQALSSSLNKSDNKEQSANLVSGAWTVATVEQKKALLNILTGIGGKGALEAVRTAVQSTEPSVRSSAIRALGSWNSAEAAPDLLRVAQSTSDSAERMLALRSYLAVATDSDLKPEARLEMCTSAAALVKGPEETKLLLSSLGNIDNLNSLKLVQPFLNNPEVKEEAAAAILRIADKVLQSQNAKASAKAIEEALDGVSQSSVSAALKERAEKLKTTARSK